MTRYTTRVVLHNAAWDDYEALHGYMESQRFSRIIKNDDGIAYHMPDAEYNLEADIDRATVMARARAAAGKTGKKFAVLVTESNGRTWHGLEQVK
jgi:hypothetical protein